MTVGLGIVVRDKGCVLACDSRVMAGYSIVSDDCEKFVLCGSAVALVSGNDGGLVDAIKGSRNLVQLHKRALTYTVDTNLTWDLLIWDRTTSRLYLLDQAGSFLPLGATAAIGRGGEMAQGFLDAFAKAPVSLVEASARAQAGVVATCRRNAACGGLVRVIVVPQRGRVVVAA